jgi:putative transposase
VILGHQIALDPTHQQAVHCRRACGTARYAYNWGLAEWQRMGAAGEKPSMAVIKRRWNEHRKAERPCTYEVTKRASGQAITDLGIAFANFFRDSKKPRKQGKFRYPKFKKKRLNESFALWVDQFDLDPDRARIPKFGWVGMRENVRFCGVIVGATVSFEGGRWFISVQVETGGERAPARSDTVAGVDLGSRALATIAGENSGIESIPGAKARRRPLGRIKRQQRRISLQKHRGKRAGQKVSHRQFVRQLRLSKLHACLANIRRNAAHKLTTSLVRRFETIVIEDECIRHGQQPQPCRRCTGLRIARNRTPASRQGRDAWRTHHDCRSVLPVNANLFVLRLPHGPERTQDMHVEHWICSECGAQHERDANAAINLRRLGLAEAEPTCGDMVPLPAFLEVRQAPWLNRELN